MGAHGRSHPSFGMTPTFQEKENQFKKKINLKKIQKVVVIQKEGRVRPRVPILILL